MTAAILQIIPRAGKGRRRPADPSRDVLRFLPWGYKGRAFIYALAFDGDVVKVGQTRSPRKRLTQHWNSAKGEVRWIHIFESMHTETATLIENAVPAAFAQFAEQINGSEWFFATASKAEVIAAIRPVIFQAKERVRTRWAEAEARKTRADAMYLVLQAHGLVPLLDKPN